MKNIAGDVSGAAVHLTTRSQNGAVKQHTVYRELRKEVEAKSLLLECCNTVAKSLQELQDPPSPGVFSLVWYSKLNSCASAVTLVLDFSKSWGFAPLRRLKGGSV